MIDKLDDNEAIDLLACGWFEAGLFHNRQRNLKHAERMFATLGPTSVASYGRRWLDGYARSVEGMVAVPRDERT